jgi:hypothetical protein
MSLWMRIVAVVTLLGAVAAVLPEETSAQEIDFGKVDKFESLASGTLRVDAPPKTIVDDGERHVVILTVWNADAETKVYWRSPDGNAPPHHRHSRTGRPNIPNPGRVQTGGRR